MKTLVLALIMQTLTSTAFGCDDDFSLAAHAQNQSRDELGSDTYSYEGHGASWENGGTRTKR